MSDNEYVATQKEAADFLKVSTKSISRYRKRGLPYKLVLNPVVGKQEVRFRYADLERWDEGRQLLATYARDGEETAAGEARQAVGADFLDDLLLSYKQQIEILREQLEDMREQLARRDRQIDDLMRLMVGLQLEYKPLPAADEPVSTEPVPTEPVPTESVPAEARQTDGHSEERAMDIYEAMVLPTAPPKPPRPEPVQTLAEPPQSSPAKMQKTFSWKQLSASIQRLRKKGKSYGEIARGLNQINVTTLSGHPEWTVLEVQALLPGLVESVPGAMADRDIF